MFKDVKKTTLIVLLEKNIIMLVIFLQCVQKKIEMVSELIPYLFINLEILKIHTS